LKNLQLKNNKLKHLCKLGKSFSPDQQSYTAKLFSEVILKYPWTLTLYD